LDALIGYTLLFNRCTVGSAQGAAGAARYQTGATVKSYSEGATSGRSWTLVVEGKWLRIERTAAGWRVAELRTGRTVAIAMSEGWARRVALSRLREHND
jgi:hypothetical protein